MRSLLLCILLLVACAAPQVHAPGATQDQDREYIAGLLSRTVQVRVNCLQGQYAGTGVVLSSDARGTVVATAAHVTKPFCLYTYRTHGSTSASQQYEAVLVDNDKSKDVALLYGKPLEQGLEPLEESNWYLGMPVVAVGYPRQIRTEKLGLQVTRGVLATDLSAHDLTDAGEFRITASFWSGSSGGPVFDSEGKLLGLTISTWRVSHGQRIYPVTGEYYVTSAEHVMAAYRRFTKNFQVQELACKCGIPVPIAYYNNATKIAKRAQVLRDLLGTPLTVRSGYRTHPYNTKVGGAKASAHLVASALDLHSAHWDAEQLATFYEGLIRIKAVEDGGLGVYPREDGGWIHIDLGAPRRWRG